MPRETELELCNVPAHLADGERPGSEVRPPVWAQGALRQRTDDAVRGEALSLLKGDQRVSRLGAPLTVDRPYVDVRSAQGDLQRCHVGVSAVSRVGRCRRHADRENRADRSKKTHPQHVSADAGAHLRREAAL